MLLRSEEHRARSKRRRSWHSSLLVWFVTLSSIVHAGIFYPLAAVLSRGQNGNTQRRSFAANDVVELDLSTTPVADPPIYSVQLAKKPKSVLKKERTLLAKKQPVERKFLGKGYPKPQPDADKKLFPRKEELSKVELDQPETAKAQENARFLSDKNREVKDETQARVAMLEKSQGALSNTPPAGAENKQIPTPSPPGKTAMGRPNPNAVITPTPSLLTMRVPATPDSEGRKALPRSMQMLSIQDFRDVLESGPAPTSVSPSTVLLPPGQRGGRGATWKRIRAALQNFTPGVKIGNQTVLGTRADPFAVYIAQMHRKIHDLWGYGFLDALEKKEPTHPLNDRELKSLIEVAIDANGKVIKATVVKGSGNMTYDAAALDTMFRAEPYPATPQNIRSGDGNVYLHWWFHRNHRQCGTFGVTPYILK